MWHTNAAILDRWSRNHRPLACLCSTINRSMQKSLPQPCDATLRAMGLMPSCTPVRGCGCFVQKGATFFFFFLSLCELKPFAQWCSLQPAAVPGSPLSRKLSCVSGARTDSSSECSAANGRLPCANWHQYLWNRRRHGRQSDELFLTHFPWIHWRKF